MIPKIIHYVWLGGGQEVTECQEMHSKLEKSYARLRD